MANEVRIDLTEAQKAKIKTGTGKDMSEIRVSNLEKNPAVSPGQSSLRTGDVGSMRAGDENTMRGDEIDSMRAGDENPTRAGDEDGSF